MRPRAVILALVLAGRLVPAAAEAPPVLDCAGAFARNADEASLVRRFGRANVVATDVPGAEGATLKGTAVFPKDPRRRIEIVWFDEKRRRRPSAVTVRGEAAWTVRTAGAAAHAVALKMPLGAVEDANGKPFKLQGFGWDLGGYGTGWQGGRLDAIPGGCTLSLRFDPDPQVQGEVLTRASGDRTFSSRDAAVRAVRPRVSELSIGWPE